MASLWTELRRRNVVRVAIAYSAAVLALLQVADLVLSNLGASAWISQMLIIAAALGFPVALVLAWLFEMTPEGQLPDPSIDAIRDDSRFVALAARFARSSEADESPASASRRLPFVIPSPLTAASYFVQGGVHDVD